MAQIPFPTPAPQSALQGVRNALPGTRNLQRLGLALILPIGLLILWQLVVNAGVYGRGQLPAPIDVWRAAEQLWNSGALVNHIQISVERVIRGFGIGSLIAVAIALVVGLSPIAGYLIDPTVQAFRAIPSLAWVPLFVLWMGIGEQPKITLIAVGAFFPVYANLVSGIRQIDRKLIEAADAYGYRRIAMAWEVILPASLPSLMTGLRLGLAQAWLFLVAAELIGASTGLGFLLVDGQNSGRADVIVLSIILLAILGKVTDVILQKLEGYLLRWTDTVKV
ncbi:MAG: ABC transporter permease [Thermomicrobiales bacterium]|nr:ABC transporter permease [Thermomicrobiales bacterium]